MTLAKMAMLKYSLIKTFMKQQALVSAEFKLLGLLCFTHHGVLIVKVLFLNGNNLLKHNKEIYTLVLLIGNK